MRSRTNFKGRDNIVKVEASNHYHVVVKINGVLGHSRRSNFSCELEQKTPPKKKEKLLDVAVAFGDTRRCLKKKDYSSRRFSLFLWLSS